MKRLIIPFAFLLLTTNLFAQSNENKAKSEYFAAKEAYNYANYKECIDHLNTTENLLGSTNPKILHLKIKAYCNLNEYSKAFDAQKVFFEKATDPNDSKYNDILMLLSEINKNAADDFVEVGKTYADKGNYTQAIKEFSKALEIERKNIKANFYLGFSLQRNNEYEKAINAYLAAKAYAKKIVNKSQKNEWLYYIEYNKAISYFHMKKYTASIISYQNAIKAKPNDAISYYNIAVVYTKLNNPLKTEESLYLAIEKGYCEFKKIEGNPEFADAINTDKYKKLKTRIFDKRDGQSYKTATVGNQFWMAESLRYKTENSWCFDDENTDCLYYGRTYTWDAAMEACPDGWHLPSDDEWKKLEIYLGMTKKQTNKSGEKRIVDKSKFIPANGFTLDSDGKIYWTSSLIYGNTPHFRIIDLKESSIFRFWTEKDNRYQVRCIKD